MTRFHGVALLSMAVVIILVAASFSGIAPIAQAAKSSKLSAAQVAANTALETFVNGCIGKSKNLGGWADKQINFVKATDIDKKKLSGFWKNLGYPVPHKIKGLWAAVRKPVWLYQHENNGCTVTTHAAISADSLEKAFKTIADKTDEKIEYVMDRKSSADGKVTSVLLSFNPDIKTQKAYFLARSIQDENLKVRTILHYIRSEDRLKI